MMRMIRDAGLAVVALGFAACGSIGDGVEPVSFELRVGGVAEDAEVFECLAGNPQARVTFSNNTVGDFVRRASWESSDPSVLTVSDGTIITGEGQFFNGTLLPMSAGTATLTATYLNFEDSIEVTVSPMRIELSPADQTIAQGSRLQMQATGILDGVDALSATSLASLGSWSIQPGGTDAVSEITAQSGVLTANNDVAGLDRARFRIDFCDREAEIAVAVVDQDISTLSLRSEDALDTPATTVELVPDASRGLRAIATYSGGLTQDITGSVVFDFADSDIVYSAVRGVGVVTSFIDAGGMQTQLTAQFDPDGDVTGDEIFSQTVDISVLDVTLDPASIQIMPSDSTMLPDTELQFQSTGVFTGTGGPVTFDLTRDVRWSSSDSSIAVINNVNGARGFVLSSAEEFGQVEIGAARQLGDGPADTPTTTLTVGSVDGQDNVELTALSVAPLPAGAAAEAARGTALALSATGTLANSMVSDLSQDLTTVVVWSSSDESLAVVGNANGARGLVRVLTDAPDQNVTITARFFDTRLQPQAVAGTLDLTLNPSSP